VFHLFAADGATLVGEPTDPSESERIEWVEPDKVPWLIEHGQVYDGMSLTGLLWTLAFSAP
jgi:8-oxo-dGDP phosphatase